MNSFPSELIPTIDSSSETYIPTLKSESDGNYPKVRRLVTKSREKFNLKFTNITIEKFNTLNAFFIANQGLSILYTSPDNGATYTCVFMQDELKKRHKSQNIVSTELRMEEV